MFPRLKPRWTDVCVVAATGPSLTPEVAEVCRGIPTVTVNDAYKLFPDAEVLYGCDPEWWYAHDGAKEFRGERWSSHGHRGHNDKVSCAKKFGLNLVRGSIGDGFCVDQFHIHYGENSGFQAVNLAGYFMGWRGRAVLVGFDMRAEPDRRHFFGNHPKGLHREKNASQIAEYFGRFISHFEKASRSLPEGFEIVNATPGSALRCFPQVDLREALKGRLDVAV